MANWCSNYLQIKGSKESISKIVDILKQNPTGKNFYETLIGLEPGADYRSHKWYDLNIKRFGCKWDTDYNLEEMRITDDTIGFGFESAWSPPVAFIFELSKQYGVTCTLEYSEPGNEFAGRTISNPDGTFTEEDYEYREGTYKLDMGFWDWLEGELEYWKSEGYTEEDIKENEVPFVTPEDMEKILKRYKEVLEEEDED